MSTALSTPAQHPTIPPQEDHFPDWKRQLAERVDAYRSRHPEHIPPVPSRSNPLTDSRASKIARSVASRYAAAPSYSEVVQAAERTALQAQVALANRVAEEKAAEEQAEREQSAARQRAAEQAAAEAAAGRITTGKQLGTPVMPRFANKASEMRVHQAAPEPEPSLEDLLASALVEPRSLLPSKLIEFPRELVSSRRARPRLPELPNGGVEPPVPPQDAAQLRIFEVQPEVESEIANGENKGAESPIAATEVEDHPIGESAVSSPAGERTATEPRFTTASVRAAVSSPARTQPASARVSAYAPARPFRNLEWAAISLDNGPAARPRTQESSAAESVPFLADAAPMERRLMALAVDFAAVTAGFLAFVLVFAAATPYFPTGLSAVVAGGVVYISLWVLYQMLFFSLSGATAGMFYARIALCTFNDQNPTREALRRRLAAWWVSCLPLGIGFFWCFVDEDNLSWHDRITRMYQRSY